jgi:hypothetical protein
VRTSGGRGESSLLLLSSFPKSSGLPGLQPVRACLLALRVLMTPAAAAAPTHAHSPHQACSRASSTWPSARDACWRGKSRRVMAPSSPSRVRRAGGRSFVAVPGRAVAVNHAQVPGELLGRALRRSLGLPTSRGGRARESTGLRRDEDLAGAVNPSFMSGHAHLYLTVFLVQAQRQRARASSRCQGLPPPASGQWAMPVFQACIGTPPRTPGSR